MRSPRIRIGLVGVGKIAADGHVPALRGGAGDHFELVAAASPEGRVEGIPQYPSLAVLLEAESIEAVAICTPPAHRAELVRAALAAGVHVLLEKPPATSVAALRSLAAIAASRRRSLFASWHAREAPAVAVCAAWLAGRQANRVQIDWLEDVRVWHPGQDWLLEADGFGVFDPAINALSILTALLGDPLTVTQAALERPSNRIAPMRAQLCGTIGGAMLEAAFDGLHVGAPCWTIALHCQGDIAVIGNGGHSLLINGDPIALGPVSEYPRLYERFAALIHAGISDVDARPLQAVEDSFAVATWHEGPPFAWTSETIDAVRTS